MAKYTYQQFFKKFPEIYQGFCDVVEHAKNFEEELRRQSLVEGAQTLLSIGAGDGELELSLAKSEKIKLSYIDPSPSASEKYQKKAQELGVKEYCTNTFIGGFEDYADEVKHDLVLSIHSWYAFGKNEALLRKALQLVRPSGHFFLTLISRESLVWKLADLFQNKEGSDNLCSEDISEFAHTLGLQHQYIQNSRSFPLEYFVADGKLTKAACDVASFLNFSSWEEISPDLKDETLQYFLREQQHGRIEFYCGCLIFQA